jgi:hypothetical protein
VELHRVQPDVEPARRNLEALARRQVPREDRAEGFRYAAATMVPRHQGLEVSCCTGGE